MAADIPVDEAKAQLLAIQKSTLQNQKCIDCNAPSPTWASPMYGSTSPRYVSFTLVISLMKQSLCSTVACFFLSLFLPRFVCVCGMFCYCRRCVVGSVLIASFYLPAVFGGTSIVGRAFKFCAEYYHGSMECGTTHPDGEGWKWTL